MPQVGGYKTRAGFGRFGGRFRTVLTPPYGLPLSRERRESCCAGPVRRVIEKGQLGKCERLSIGEIL